MNTFVETEQAVIFGSHINAYSIARSLREIGWNGRIVMVREEGDPRALGEYLRDLVDLFSFDSGSDDDFLDQLALLLEGVEKTWLFFTSERYHDLFQRHRTDPRLEDTVYHLGPMNDPGIVLDRVLFYRHLEDHGIRNVPRTISGDDDPFEAFGETFFLRVRRSWKNLRKLPAGAVIRGGDSLAREEQRLRNAGLAIEDWCFQELLSVAEEDNVSVCGWHDPAYHHYAATRKLLQTPPLAGNGDICELLDPPPGLFETTERVLDSLCYHGPFELEFIRDKRSLNWPIIELNPRFWLQHRLIEMNTGHLLLRRYLGEDARPAQSGRYRRWIRLDRIGFRLLHGDLSGLSGIKYRSLFVPTPGRLAIVGFRTLFPGHKD